MQANRKRTYRYLLYRAMLDIRPIAWTRLGWNPFHWSSRRKQIRRAGDLANWLHNLAQFSANEFERFDEEWFWRDSEWIRSRHPDCGLERYRDRFTQLAESQPQVAGTG